MTEPNPDTWQDALTRRLRALLRTVPLQQLEVGKARRNVSLDAQDLRALALRALDLTIERMGLGTGPTYDELRDALRPLVLACDSSVAHDEVDSIIRIVIDELLNERNRRRAFREPYLAIDPHRIVRRELDFHLLQEHSAPDGAIVLKATTEAINLYAGMLEYPVEDAQIAEEAVLRSQVNRGRIADAVQTAKRARLRSIEYEQKLLSYLETTRRDVTQIDWVDDVLELVRNAREHIGERVDTEGDLIRAVDQHLESATSEAGRQLAALRDVLSECLDRHLRLQQRLIAANQEYLDEHDRQAFRPRAMTPLPDLEAEVLRVALELPMGLLANHVEWLLTRFLAPSPRPVIYLPALIERLLAPRRADEDEPIDLTDSDLERFESMPPRFSEDDHRTVNSLLANLDGEHSLSTLLADSRQRGMSESGQRLLVLRTLLAFDPKDGGSGLRADPRGCSLQDDVFTGDDLLITASKCPPT